MDEKELICDECDLKHDAFILLALKCRHEWAGNRLESASIPWALSCGPWPVPIQPKAMHT